MGGLHDGESLPFRLRRGGLDIAGPFFSFFGQGFDTTWALLSMEQGLVMGI
jgi:hypothetical protein